MEHIIQREGDIIWSTPKVYTLCADSLNIKITIASTLAPLEALSMPPL